MKSVTDAMDSQQRTTKRKRCRRLLPIWESSSWSFGNGNEDSKENYEDDTDTSQPQPQQDPEENDVQSKTVKVSSYSSVATKSSSSTSDLDSINNNKVMSNFTINASNMTAPPSLAVISQIEKDESQNAMIQPHCPSTPRRRPVIVTPKRQNYLSWDDYFLGIALLSSKRSKDPINAEGACLVDDRQRIVAIGYNGFPKGCPDTIFPWNQYRSNNNNNTTSSTSESWLHSKQPYVCSAISNAILNKCREDVSGCKLYVTHFPTSDCTKVLIQSDINELIILQRHHNDQIINNNNCTEDKNDDDYQASLIMLGMAKVKVRYHQPEISSWVIDFGIPENNEETRKEEKTTINTQKNQCFEEEELTGVNQNDTTKTTAANSIKSTLNTSPTYTTQEQTAIDILHKEADYDATSMQGKNGRRTNYLSWDDYFMAVAFWTAQRSKDPNTQVGACLVNPTSNIILGCGYNGFPRGLSDDILPWSRDTSNNPPLFTKYLYVTHAEVNAILNKGSSNVVGATMYVALFPCQNCAKFLIQAGIRKVVYVSDRYHDTKEAKASRIMLNCANVECVPYRRPKSNSNYIVVDFSSSVNE